MTDAPEPLTLSQAKQHLRLDDSFTDDDETLEDLIVDAREFVEAETGLILTPRTLTETARGLGAWIDLRSWPITSVDTIRYPVQGALTALAEGSWVYSVNARPVRLLPATWGWGIGAAACGLAWTAPSLPVEIDVTAGYATPDLIPNRAIRAMKLLIGHWYSNRSAAEVGSRAAGVEVPFAVTQLLYRLKDRAI